MKAPRRPSIIMHCETCGVEMRVKASHAYRRRCCSIECSKPVRREIMSGTGNHQHGLKGPKNASWKGGRKISSYGYVLVSVPEHPCANGDGNVFEHRLVMEHHLGRLLVRGEVVHHINEIKTDNRIENLKLMTLGEHSAEHNRERAQARDAASGRFVPRVELVEVEELSETARGANGVQRGTALPLPTRPSSGDRCR